MHKILKYTFSLPPPSRTLLAEICKLTNNTLERDQTYNKTITARLKASSNEASNDLLYISFKLYSIARFDGSPSTVTYRHQFSLTTLTFFHSLCLFVFGMFSFALPEQSPSLACWLRANGMASLHDWTSCKWEHKSSVGSKHAKTRDNQHRISVILSSFMNGGEMRIFLFWRWRRPKTSEKNFFKQFLWTSPSG